MSSPVEVEAISIEDLERQIEVTKDSWGMFIFIEFSLTGSLVIWYLAKVDTLARETSCDDMIIVSWSRIVTESSISEDFISTEHLQPAKSSSTVVAGEITIILRTRQIVRHFAEPPQLQRTNKQQHSTVKTVSSLQNTGNVTWASPGGFSPTGTTFANLTTTVAVGPTWTASSGQWFSNDWICFLVLKPSHSESECQSSCPGLLFDGDNRCEKLRKRGNCTAKVERQKILSW